MREFIRSIAIFVSLMSCVLIILAFLITDITAADIEPNSLLSRVLSNKLPIILFLEIPTRIFKLILVN